MEKIRRIKFLYCSYPGPVGDVAAASRRRLGDRSGRHISSLVRRWRHATTGLAQTPRTTGKAGSNSRDYSRAAAINADCATARRTSPSGPVQGTGLGSTPKKDELDRFSYHYRHF